jgi:hypothetical protein
MIWQRRKASVVSFVVFVLLIVATAAGFVLMQQNQDTRQQASSPTAPYPDAMLTPVTSQSPSPSISGSVTPSPTVGPDLSKKGIVASSYSGNRPSTESACGGVWMNSFCYMPGDELAGGKIIVANGRYNYPYIEDKQTYQSISFNAPTIKEVVGSTQNLGNDCNNQGLAINGICYAYGSTVNGYLVMPPRDKNCTNTSGDYCHSFLKKIEVSYSDWQNAVNAYQDGGNLDALKALYQQTYGVAFNPNTLLDPTAPNATTLQAQALIAALTNAEVIKGQAAAENAFLASNGVDQNEQARFNYNQQLINDTSLAERPQVVDQLRAGLTQQVTVEAALHGMYNDLVYTEDEAALEQVAKDAFQELFGYDPGTKYGDLDGLLGSIGIDLTTFAADRQSAAAQRVEYNQNIEEFEQAYAAYASGTTTSLDELKQQALDLGILTVEQVAQLPDEGALALIIENAFGKPRSQARAEAVATIDNSQKAYAERELTGQYEASLREGDGVGDLGALYDLYELYTGTALTNRVSETWLRQEISKHNGSVALLAFQDDQDVKYLQNFYQANFEVGLAPDERMPSNPKNLLTTLYGNETGMEIYYDVVLPNKLQSAVANFSIDGGT